MRPNHFKLILFIPLAILTGSLVVIVPAAVANPQTPINVPSGLALTLLSATVAGLSVLGAARERERTLSERTTKSLHSYLSPLKEDISEIGQSYRDIDRTLLAVKDDINGLKSQQRETTSHIHAVDTRLASSAENADLRSRRILNLLRKGAKPNDVLNRLQAAENRLLAAYDGSSFDQSDQLAAIADDLANRGGLLQETLDRHLVPLRDLYSQDRNRMDQLAEKMRLLVDIEAALSALDGKLDVQRTQAKEHLENLSSRLSTTNETRTEALTQTVRDEVVSVRSHITSETADLLRQTEALLQLIPRVNSTTRRLPPSGGWAMSADGLLLLSDLVLQRQPRNILELGSGSSTIWMGLFAKQCGSKLTTVEHDNHYADETARLIKDFGLEDTVNLRLAELTEIRMNGRDAMWYDPQALEGLDGIDMLVVDGPPKATGPEARLPALSMLVDSLAPNCTVILDDMHRKEEQTIFSRWQEAYPDFKPHETSSPRIGVLHRGTSGQA